MKEVALVALMALPLVNPVAPAIEARPIAMANAPHGLPVEEVCQRIVMAQFLELKSLTFVVDDRPKMAEQWLRDMEQIFNFMNCLVNEKVRMTGFQLRGNAMMWWRTTKLLVFPEGGKCDLDGISRGIH